MQTGTYQELLAETLPQVIETDRQYEESATRFGDLMVKRRMRTPEETKLMRLLGILIKDYDSRHALPPDDSSPGELLAFLVEHSGKKPGDLLPVFGQRSHVSEALRGTRKISADQARKLGAMFKVSPGLFI
jgi:HTH-type transcriptional regulator/antitoxin HigA